MVIYRKLYNDFERFISALDVDDLSVHEKKLINLLIEHFDEIASWGTAGGKRAKILNNIIQKEGMSASDQITLNKKAEEVTAFPFKRLEKIKIRDFRGFSREETFDFDKNYIFIYGPNGSGKSSLCEALEFSLLGYINEAEYKRIPVDQYIKNLISQKASKLSLTAIDHNEKTIEVTPSQDFFHFCFIEQNRIFNFARISANTPSVKSHLLSILFGLDEFAKFANNFTSDIESKIDVEGKHAIKLSQKLGKIALYKENIEEEEEKLDVIDDEKKIITKSFNLAIPFDYLDSYLIGDGDNDGRIKELDSEIQKPIGSIIEHFDVGKIIKKISEINTLLNQFLTLDDEYQSKKDKISFRKLYELVLELKVLSEDRCPVCETPVSSTKVDPFLNAEKRFAELKDTAEIERKRNNAISNLRTEIDDFVSKLRVWNSNSKSQNSDIYIEMPETLNPQKGKININIKVGEGLNEIKKFIDVNLADIKEIDGNIGNKNSKIKIENERRKNTIVEKNKLQRLSEKVSSIKTREKSANDNIENYKEKIGQFAKKNEGLIKKVEKEKPQIEENKKYVKAYHSLLDRLNEYIKEQPIEHLKNLNKLIVDFYNAINKHDGKCELLSKLELPANEGETIKAYFQDLPDMKQDALHVLSEGHLRCLGLAILLAKNVNDGNKILVFDDVVNAIDDDHRGGVRKLLFENEYFKDTQIIITSHSEPFITELDMCISIREYDKLVKRINFTSPDSDRTIVVKYDQSFNYLKKAETFLGDSEYKPALANCRQALENLINKLWIGLSRFYKVDISVIKRSPKLAPDLMSVTQSLRKVISRHSNNIVFTDLLNLLDYFLAIKTKSNAVWNYLNKGSHDEFEGQQFDPLMVKEIVEKLIELDSELVFLKNNKYGTVTAQI